MRESTTQRILVAILGWAVALALFFQIGRAHV